MKRLFPFFLIVVIGLLVAGCSVQKPTYQISVNFGKAYAYSPHSNEILDWSGSLKVEGGTLDSLFKLTYGITDWDKGYGGCSREYSRKLDNSEWKTDVKPGSGRGLEGIRFFIDGDSSTIITIETKAGTAKFKLATLLDQEYLEFPVIILFSRLPFTWARMPGRDSVRKHIRKYLIVRIDRES
jgi:hypothetical protein